VRIAMILSTPLPPREGIGFYAWNLACYLTRQGHRVHLITRGGYRPTLREDVEGITIWRPTFIPVYPFHVHLHGLFVSRLLRELESAIDVFHLHMPLVPLISTDRPILITFHSSLNLDAQLTPVESLYTLLMKLQSPISYRLELNNIKYATRVTAVSPWVAEAIQNYPQNPGNIEIMGNGVDTNDFKPADQNERREKVVLTVGRLGPGKGLHDLIEAAGVVIQEIPEARFLIVGEGNLRASLEKLIHQRRLENCIQMTGHISNRARLIDLFRKASLFVLPSHHEGLPTVLLEAMACGCPVLATRIGGIPYVIQDGENGRLISPGNVRELSQGIIHLLENCQLSISLGRQAHKTVEERFSWETIGAQFVQLYRSLAQGVGS